MSSFARPAGWDTPTKESVDRAREFLETFRILRAGSESDALTVARALEEAESRGREKEKRRILRDLEAAFFKGVV